MRVWLSALTVALLTFAQNAIAAPDSDNKWQLGLSSSASNVMDDIHSFHNLLMVIITAVSVFVLFLLIYVAVRYNRKANPKPSNVSHNTFIEIIWTVVPVLILLVIAVPSFRLLAKQLNIPQADVTIKVTGYQWYWNYEYLGDQKVAFDSVMLKDEELKPGQKRLLSVDNVMVVPVNKVVKLQLTAADVLHAFAVQAFGIKMDTVPGRLNQTWFKAEKTGTFYGQCSELCGQGHAFMPIEVKVVTQAEYEAWLKSKKSALAPQTQNVAQSQTQTKQ